jgi:predicted Rossmann fold flavoprotein
MVTSYDVAVIGAGAAGCMAAIRAAQCGKNVVVAERNGAPGKKVLLTGNGRCNLTNTASLDVFIEKFTPRGEFLRSAFFAFSNQDLMEFFRAQGLPLKIEDEGRVFPATDDARLVVAILEHCLKEYDVTMRYRARVTACQYAQENHFILTTQDGQRIDARKVIVATGGKSYEATGSTGDGYAIARSFGHTVTPLMPALVPLIAREGWVKDLQGLALENVRVSFYYGGKKRSCDIGELLFTHFGVSGPLVLDMSGGIVEMLTRHKEVQMKIDLKPGLEETRLERDLMSLFASHGNVHIKNSMQDLLPKSMVAVFLSLAKVPLEKPGHQITQRERKALVRLCKVFPLTITGSLGIEQAMVTRGGVTTKEIDPRTLESKIARGLYFAGEVLEGAASSGGYNLQKAFSTGYLAGEKAAETAREKKR